MRRNGGAWGKKGSSFCHEDSSVQGFLEREPSPEDFRGGGGVRVTGAMGGCPAEPVAWSLQPPRHTSAGRELCAPPGEGWGAAVSIRSKAHGDGLVRAQSLEQRLHTAGGSQFSPQGL